MKNGWQHKQNKMKKILIRSALVLIFVFCAFLLNGKPKQACARYWGPSETCPLTVNGTHLVSDFYPSGTSSVDINFWITINGTPPPGTRAWVQVGTDPNNTCGGELKCLTRYDETSVPATAGLQTTKLDKIGCSSSGCRVGGVDLIPVSAYLDPTPPASAGCTAAIISSDGSNMVGSQLNISNMNGFSIPVYVSITCTPVVNYTCTTTATRQCQQNQVNQNGCADGWIPDTTTPTLTCDQSGGNNVCCVKPACISLSPPTVTVTCSGCTN